MRCTSCGTRVLAKNAVLFRKKIFLCPSCFALATSAQQKVEAEIAAARAQALMYLEQHILSGGLVAAAKTPTTDPTSPREDFPSRTQQQKKER